ncbi:MAG: cation:proton antiporter [Candidatus Woesearchaeota archaeon]|nr:cation:proton antiporter [Candidatus Woesearchaeota archaeon]
MQQGLPILGLIILVGVVGNMLFRRTRIPESLFLIVIGVLIGPVLGWVPRELFLENITFFVSIALIIVLLNSGLNLDLYRTLKNAWYASLFTLFVFGMTLLTVTLTVVYVFKWPVLYGLFLGIIGSGTTTVTITHLVEKLKISKDFIDTDTKNLLVLESVVNDLTVITGGSILLAVIKPGAMTGSAIAQILFNELVVSLVVGAICGVCWVFLYAYKLHGNKLSYIFTLGVALMIYSGVESLALNGAITIMMFSLVLGNHDVVVQKLRVRAKLFKGVERDVFSMKKTDVEFTFLIRTFFFVLLGIVFDLSVLQNWWVIYLALGVLAAELVARYLSCVFMTRVHPSFKKARFIRTVLVASGVTSTLVAFLSIEAGVNIPHLAEIVLLLVFLTTTTAILGTAIQERRTMAKLKS